MAIAPTSPFLLLVVVLQGPMMMMTPCSSQPSSCRFDYTSLALLSCQETPPQSPTRSCCDALLYAIDDWPEYRDKGACCLCAYVVAKTPDFDLAGAYLSCGGRDSAAVNAWKATGGPALGCDGPCRLGAASPPPPPPPPPPPSTSGGSAGGRTNKRRRQDEQAGLGAGAIVAIVLGILVGAALIGWCVYHIFCSAADKSPDPSNRGSASQGIVAGGALEMPRLSSARRSTSVLLE